jgi:hypothetical protein
MPIKARLIIQGTPFRDEINAINALEEMMREAAQRTQEIVEPHFLQEVAHYPPAAKLPFGFGTEKSKRYYFGVIVKNKRRGGRYVRTGQLQQSFFMRFLQSRRGVEFVFGSSSDASKWVVGSFDKRRDYQVIGHKRTGWFPIASTANYWRDVAQDEFMKMMPVVYAEFKSKRQNR